MERIGSLYHWAPTDRRPTILHDGLVPGSLSTVATGELGYVCLGPSPRKAWTYSGDLAWAAEIDAWDLWQITLAEQDEIRIRTDFGYRIIEVKVHNVIPPDRVWWVGERMPWLTAGKLREG